MTRRIRRKRIKKTTRAAFMWIGASNDGLLSISCRFAFLGVGNRWSKLELLRTIKYVVSWITLVCHLQSVEALAHIIHPLAEQYVFALLKLPYSAHFCHCCSIYDESLVRGESGANLHSFTCCCLVSFYLLTHSPLSSTRLLAEQYVFASAQAAYLCFRIITVVLTDCTKVPSYYIGPSAGKHFT